MSFQTASIGNTSFSPWTAFGSFRTAEPVPSPVVPAEEVAFEAGVRTSRSGSSPRSPWMVSLLRASRPSGLPGVARVFVGAVERNGSEGAHEAPCPGAEVSAGLHYQAGLWSLSRRRYPDVECGALPDFGFDFHAAVVLLNYLLHE